MRRAKHVTNNRIALVTGGSRGIGAATAVLAARQGYTVCIAYKEATAAAEAVIGEIQRNGGTATAFRADISQEADVLRLFSAIDTTIGPLKALVNNAGVLARATELENMSVERWMPIIMTNIVGTMLCTREAVKRMSTRHGGSGGVIVNVSSAASRTGSAREYVDYAASKGAVDSFTIGVAREVAAQGIRVNAVRPGFIHTEIHAAGGDPNRIERLRHGLPLGRGGEPTEVAAAIMWLLSDNASYVTGSFIDLAGGI